MKSRKSSALKSKIWLGIFPLLLIGGAAWYFLIRPATAEAQSTTSSATKTYTSTVTRGDLQIAADGSGTLVAHKTADLSFSTQGTIAEVKVKIGDDVKTGDILARLGDTDSLEAQIASQQLQLLQAQKNLRDLQQNADVSLAQAYQDMLKAQDTYDEAVKTQKRSEMARCSSAKNASLKATLDAAQTKLETISKLYSGSDAWITAKSNYDTALANFNYCITYTNTEKIDAVATVDVAKSKLDLATKTYETLKTSSGIDPDELTLNEAKVTALEKQLAQAEEDLNGITLVAPFDGRITYLAADAGTVFDTSKFITVSDVNHPTLNISVDETDMDKMVIGTPATVVFDALPDQTFTGQVIQVNPELTTSGQYRVAKGLIQLDEQAAKTVGKLPLGLSATVKIISKEVKGALLVPNEAVKDLGNGEYGVFVVDQNGKMRLSFVKVGISDSTRTEITSGLQEGDSISTGLTQTTTSKSTSTK